MRDTRFKFYSTGEFYDVSANPDENTSRWDSVRCFFGGGRLDSNSDTILDDLHDSLSVARSRCLYD